MHQALLILVVVATCSVMDGCGFSGTFETGNREAFVSFKSGKAYMTMLGDTEVCDYEMRGNKIVVHTKADNIVFTLNADGTIESPLGNMKKRKTEETARSAVQGE